MTRKYIYITIIVLINVLAIGVLYYNKAYNEVYSDKLAEDIYDKFSKSTDDFLDYLNSETALVIDSLSSNDFSSETNLLNFFQNTKGSGKFHSVIVMKNKKVFYFQHDKKSIISTLDSISGVKQIELHRYKNGKIIGKWKEIVILDELKNKINSIKNTPNTFHWIVSNVEKVVFVGYYNKENNLLIIYKFDFDKFSLFYGNLKHLNNKQNAIITQKNNIIIYGKDSVFCNNQIDKLPELAIIDAIKRIYAFKSDSINIFSFKYKNGLDYWALIKKANRVNINYFITIIPDNSIKYVIDIWDTSNLIIISILLILSIATIIIILKNKHKINLLPDSSEISDLLKNNENRYLEFKSSLRWDYRQEKENTDLESVIVKTIAAFGNSDGGVLLIGVDDDKNILGLQKDLSTLKKHNIDYYEIYLRNLFHKYFGVKYTTENIRVEFAKINDKEICVIRVSKAKEPAYIKINKKGRAEEKFYVRSGNSSQEITSLKEINDYIFERFKKE